MNKIITIITGAILAMTIALTGSFAATKAYAASDYQKYVKGATFLGALHGQDQNDNELVLALYDKNGDKTAYINDGVSHVYASYKEVDSTLNGIGSVERYEFEGTLAYNFFTLNGFPCLATDDGLIYVCEYLTADEVATLMSFD